MLTTCPARDAMRCGRNALVPLTTPQKSMSTTFSICSKVESRTVPANATPALLYTWLTTPKWAATSSA
jgi:hypothetical protein